jgi:hypothetical protein
MLPEPDARTFEHADCLVCGILEGCIDSVAQIQLAVAVCVRARESEERASRGMQNMALRGRCGRRDILEL